jgi:hypothetical protein
MADDQRKIDRALWKHGLKVRNAINRFWRESKATGQPKNPLTQEQGAKALATIVGKKFSGKPKPERFKSGLGTPGPARKKPSPKKSTAEKKAEKKVGAKGVKGALTTKDVKATPVTKKPEKKT